MTKATTTTTRKRPELAAKTTSPKRKVPKITLKLRHTKCQLCDTPFSPSNGIGACASCGVRHGQCCGHTRRLCTPCHTKTLPTSPCTNCTNPTHQACQHCSLPHCSPCLPSEVCTPCQRLLDN